MVVSSVGGENIHGQLGLPHKKPIGDNERPFSIKPIYFKQRVVQVGTGSRHTCVLLENGGVKCWGDHAYGQLSLTTDVISGHGDSITHSVGDNDLHVHFIANRTIESLEDLNLGQKAISINVRHNRSCATLIDGQLTCWGGPENERIHGGHSEDPFDRGDFGALLVTSGAIIPRSFHRKVVDISRGRDFSCALLAYGGVSCWGQNKYGQLGLGHVHTVGENEVGRAIVEGHGLSLIARFELRSILNVTNQSISFNASKSHSQFEISRYSWNFGDRSTIQTGQNVTHIFTRPGTYDVDLTVTDSQWRTHRFSKKLTVLEDKFHSDGIRDPQ